MSDSGSRPAESSLERRALAGVLHRVAERRKLPAVLAGFCRERFDADAVVVLLRHRRSGSWELAALAGSGLSLDDHRRLIDPASRDRLEALQHIARPLRPHGRLAGGIVVLRHEPLLRRSHAERLGRLARVVSSELVRRDLEDAARAEARLYRKLAEGIAPRDVLYHVLDEAVRFISADHLAALLVLDPAAGAWRVAAEKLVSPAGPSCRIGDTLDECELEQLQDGAAVRELTTRRDQRACLVVRSSSGDPVDAGDHTMLSHLDHPIAITVNRL